MKHTTIGLVSVLLLAWGIYFLISSNSSASELQQMGVKTMVIGVSGDLQKAMPLIHEAGYDINSISVKTSIPPMMIASFVMVKEVPFKKQDAILSALEDNAIGKLALESLIQAFKLDESIEMKNMQLKTINLYLTVPPAVQVVYKK